MDTMAHWARTLPPGTVLDVTYESLLPNAADDGARNGHGARGRGHGQQGDDAVPPGLAAVLRALGIEPPRDPLSVFGDGAAHVAAAALDPPGAWRRYEHYLPPEVLDLALADGTRRRDDGGGDEF
jgi:hypothetical protein